VLLSLVPLAATYWGLMTAAGAGESRQVNLRQEAGLRAALALYAERAAWAQRRAEGIARSRPLQRALEHRDLGALRRIVAEAPSVYVVGARGLRAGIAPRLAVRLPVEVVASTRRLGRVVAVVPLDEALVDRLRRRAIFATGDVLALLEEGRIVAASPSLRGSVPTAAGSGTVSLSGSRYRVLVAPSLPGAWARASPS